METKLIYREAAPGKVGACQLAYIFVRLNSTCNGRCPFCTVWKNKLDANDKIQWHKLLDEIVEIDPVEMNLHGGEAFLSQSFLPIVRKLDGKIPLSITTNGSLFFYNDMEFLTKNGLSRIFVSIDNVDPSVNAESRGIARLAKDLYPSMSNFKHRYPHIKIIVNHVVTKANCGTIKEFLFRMQDMDVDSVALIPVKNSESYFPSGSEVFGFNSDITDLLTHGKLSRAFLLNGIYDIFCGDNDVRKSSSSSHCNPGEKKSCNVPSYCAFLDAVTGDVYPCDTTMYRENHGVYIMGNIIHSDLNSVLTGARFRDFRNAMLTGNVYPCISGCDPCNEFSVNGNVKIAGGIWNGKRN